MQWEVYISLWWSFDLSFDLENHCRTGSVDSFTRSVFSAVVPCCVYVCVCVLCVRVSE